MWVVGGKGNAPARRKRFEVQSRSESEYLRFTRKRGRKFEVEKIEGERGSEVAEVPKKTAKRARRKKRRIETEVE